MKSKRRWNGALPAVLAASLIAIVAVAPRAAERETGMMAVPTCNLLLQQGGGSEAHAPVNGGGVIQPIAFVGNIAACSLTVDRGGYSSYSTAVLDLVQWDPATLAPDPTTIALRTRAFNVSDLQFGWIRADWNRPVVVRGVPNVAEPPRQTTAMKWTSILYGSFGGQQTIRFDSNGSPSVPAALQFPPGGGAVSPMPGGHPVLSHAVCGGDEALQGLHVIQSVTTTGSLSDTASFDLIQRFRVPVRSRLQWVEVAFGVAPRPVYYDPMIAILDAKGMAEPPASLPPSLVEGPYQYNVTAPFWGSHYDFDHLITLEPDHDYWLLVRVEHRYVLYSRALTGGESTDFTARIGPQFRRTTLGGAWSATSGQALCFKLIGEPLISGRTPARGRLRERELGERIPDVQPPPSGPRSNALQATAGIVREPGPLSLRVAPNPSAGAAFVSWSGAAGPMRVEVLDAQGRRVGGVAGVAGSDGKWLWNGARDDGRPLPAGVYFVRASDGTGRFASDRVVLIR